MDLHSYDRPEPQLHLSRTSFSYSDFPIGFNDARAWELTNTAEIDAGDERPVLPAVLFSLLIHVLAALALTTFAHQSRSPTTSPETASTSLRIQLSAPRSPPPSDTAAPEADAVPVAETTSPAPAEPPASAPMETLVDLPQVNTLPPPIVFQDQPERPTLRLLSPESLRQTIDGIAERRDTNNALIHCTALQRQSELIDCGDEREPLDYSVLERNATYEFFAEREAPQQTRTQRTMGFMLERSVAMEEQLRSADIGGAAVDRFLRELRSTASDISATGNVQLERLKNEIYANDATYQQRQRAMNPR